MKYVFSSLVALGLVASTAQAEDRPWLACWKKGITEAVKELPVSLAEHGHHITPREARWLRVAQTGYEIVHTAWRSFHNPSATASCARE